MRPSLDPRLAPMEPRLAPMANISRRATAARLAARTVLVTPGRVARSWTPLPALAALALPTGTPPVVRTQLISSLLWREIHQDVWQQRQTTVLSPSQWLEMLHVRFLSHITPLSWIRVMVEM